MCTAGMFEMGQDNTIALFIAFEAFFHVPGKSIKAATNKTDYLLTKVLGHRPTDSGIRKLTKGCLKTGQNLVTRILLLRLCNSIVGFVCGLYKTQSLNNNFRSMFLSTDECHEKVSLL